MFSEIHQHIKAGSRTFLVYSLLARLAFNKNFETQIVIQGPHHARPKVNYHFEAQR